MTKTFLSAEWRKLAMANYAVDPEILRPYLPPATEIDIWNGVCYISLVGFMFMNTRLKGIAIPFHVNFEEVNLRFYVKHKAENEWKRGVVFVKEIVSRPAITLVARTVYKESYETMQMAHSWQTNDDSISVEYKWKKKNWNTFKVIAEKQSMPLETNSEAEFITEHYWGYKKIDEQRTSEYEVTHPRWNVYPVKDYMIDVDFANVYGSGFSFLKNEKPLSVFLAEGSPITVKAANNIEAVLIEM